MSFYTMLSIDGGGMNALSSAVVLAYFEDLLIKYSKNKNARLCDYFDLFAGTSAGGILVGSYLAPNPDEITRPMFSANEVIEKYINIGSKIFKKSSFREILTLKGAIGAKYPSKRLINSLSDVFNKIKLSECLKSILIPAYNINSSKCVFFEQESAKSYIERDYYLKDVLWATASAPSYFPPAEISSLSGKKSCMIDGGVFANNPAMCGLVELDKIKTGTKRTAILSVGIGGNDSSINCEDASSWGKVGWAFPILGIILSATSQTTDYQLRSIFRSDFIPVPGYLRVDGTGIANLPKLGALDDASEENINSCIQYGKMLIVKHEKKLKTFAMNLVKKTP